MGYAYALNISHLIETFIALVVLIGVVKTLMDAIVFFMIPNVSVVLRNKRDEQISRESAFREIGMRAAISVAQFHQIGDGTPGNVNLTDLTKVFGSVEGVSRDKRRVERSRTVTKQTAISP